VITKYGGKFIVRGPEVVTLEGSQDFGRIVVIEFPSLERAKKFYYSAEYQELKAIRAGAATGSFIAVEGWVNGHGSPAMERRGHRDQLVGRCVAEPMCAIADRAIMIDMKAAASLSGPHAPFRTRSTPTQSPKENSWPPGSGSPPSRSHPGCSPAPSRKTIQAKRRHK
jgi:uncharacterized protein (DUF1330 family)